MGPVPGQERLLMWRRLVWDPLVRQAEQLIKARQRRREEAAKPQSPCPAVQPYPLFPYNYPAAAVWPVRQLQFQPHYHHHHRLY